MRTFPSPVDHTQVASPADAPAWPGSTPQRVLGAALAALALLALPGCGNDPDPGDDATATDVSDASEDTGAADTTQADSGPELTLKWTQLVPTTTEKMRAAAAIPGSPGAYVVVGEGASVALLEGGTFTDISPKNVGAAHLNAVWAASKDNIVAAGEGSTLITWDGQSWQVAGAVPPTPVVTFLSLSGDPSGDVWAVGEGAQAWRRTGAVWAPAAVTSTSGEAIGDKADFVTVSASAKGGVWIAASKGATGGGVVLHSADGKSWKGYPTPEPPRDLWAAATAPAKGSALVVGGTTDAYVARFDGDAFVGAGDVKWSLGFRSAGGTAADQLWIGGLKGQLRAWDGAAWSVVDVAPPPGTVGGFPQPSNDLLDVAVGGPEEVLLVTAYKLYRFGKQP